MTLLVQTQAPGEEVITLADAKEWLKVDTTADDNIISSLIASARLQAEHYCNARFVSQTYEETFAAGLIDLDLTLGPNTSVTEVKIGEDVLATTLYTFSQRLNRVTLTQSQTEEVTVVYTVGYGNAAAVPDCIKNAIKLMMAANYEKREDSIKRFPTASQILLTSERRWVT